MKIISGLHAFLWENPTANNCNTYLLEGGKRILIDPGHAHLFQHVEEGLSGLGLSLEDIDFVVVTHAHPDHLEGLRKFQGKPALIALSEMEMGFVRGVATRYGEALGIPHFEPHVLLREGECDVGDIHLQVIHTPGHSPGSICLHWPQKKALFTGDVVFYQGVGRTDLPGGNGEDLKQSIRRIAQIDVEYLLPGHGDVVEGAETIKANFRDIETMWFAYL
jgi:hydroxyacylglutathione hydrolase